MRRGRNWDGWPARARRGRPRAASPDRPACARGPEGAGDQRPHGPGRGDGAALAQALQRTRAARAGGGRAHRATAPTYAAEQRSAVINTALTRPADLGLPFASWTLDRLVAYLGEQGIAMRRSRISEIFIQEGL